jgi:hypothetical protein
VGDSQAKSARSARVRREPAAISVDEIADRPFARRDRRAGSDLLAADDERTASSAKAPISPSSIPETGRNRSCERIDNAKLDTVLSNSFGFGGTNATLASRYHG